jgi:hypothetical protein
MALTLNITAEHDVYLGEDKRLNFGAVYNQGELTDEQLEAAIADETATPIDVSGWDLIWVLRTTDKNATALIEKTSADGITIEGTFNASQALNTQKVIVTLADTDSYDPDASPAVALRARKYRHSLKRMDDGAETVLASGDFQFLQATAR